MRNLVDVIDQLVAIEPKLGNALKSTRSSAYFTAPERMGRLWRETRDILTVVAPLGHPKMAELQAVFGGTRTVSWGGKLRVPAEGGRLPEGVSIVREVEREGPYIIFEVRATYAGLQALHAAYGEGKGHGPWTWTLEPVLDEN